ncbi:uncharacterized protein A1O9_06916 [Exophiala aquamarina CBS 119918]|uniref:Cytochrome P450 oxidoreductase n=1 Tax=Exophiala aquamarina CBS 119918 TaxID=1182545 RepID=A0A072PA49_9EURO|nr:uncharacterized protein A1O9_06916 [Exophiala aquamarina CBS 119918]KEF56726.1 hypothetical protein A1O9_06916 [Exophiala aquamarina CBS 119918]
MSTEIHLPFVLTRENIVVASYTFILLYLVSSVGSKAYRAFFGPLSKYPGPKFRAFSEIPECLDLVQGTETQSLVALHKRYGDVVRVSPNTLSFVGTAETWNDIYGFKKTGIPENHKDPEFYMKSFNGHFDLIRAPVPHHGRQRKVISHGFSERALKEQEPLLKMYAAKLVEFFSRAVENGELVDIALAFNFATFDIMADLTFAESLHMLDTAENERWVRNIFGSIKFKNYIRALRMFSIPTRLLVTEITTRLPSLKKRAAAHFKFTSDRVSKRLAQEPDRPDITTRIIEKGGHPLEPNAVVPLGELQVVSAMFMLAGTETTATALSGLTYYLLKNPEWMKKLKDEVRGSLKCIDDMNLIALTKLPILEACLKEALRMYPPTPNGTPRVASWDGVTVAGHQVPKGTQMFVHQLATYRAEHLFKHAEDFRPDRWLGVPEFANDHKGALEPWTVGPRTCVGKNLSWHEMRLLYATVIVHFDIELCAESTNWPNQNVSTCATAVNTTQTLTATVILHLGQTSAQVQTNAR